MISEDQNLPENLIGKIKIVLQRILDVSALEKLSFFFTAKPKNMFYNVPAPLSRGREGKGCSPLTC